MSEVARVLAVCTRTPEAEALASALSAFDLKARGVAVADVREAARAPAGGQPWDAVVLSDLELSAGEISELAADLKAWAQPRLLVVVTVGARLDPARPPAGVDAALASPAHPAQTAARLELLLRLAVMEDEARLRAVTLAARGVAVDIGLDDVRRARVNVLYVGLATPSYLGLAAALHMFGATLSAAFTTFTAFDFLHERDFDAVVVNAIEKLEVGYAVCTALRRSTRLFHTPGALIIERERLALAGEAVAKGVSELLPVDASPEDLARRIMSLARERQRRVLIKNAFAQVKASEVVDAVTGLAAPGFFVDHIEAMARRAHRLMRPLSMVVARAHVPNTALPDDRDHAVRQIGSMIGRLIRAEDFAAELEPGVFAIAMPGASRATAEAAAERFAAIAECTAFGGGPSADAFQVELLCETGELNGHEGARMLLARTIRAFRGRDQFASRASRVH
jgi:two-component system cell cycle response regulator PopA